MTRDNPQLGMSREEFVIQNERLVHSVVHRMIGNIRASGLEYDDAVSIGFIGLLKAYDGFDRERFPDIRISTYAYPMIQGEILREMRDNQNQGIRVSRRAKAIAHQIRREDRDKEYSNYKDIAIDFDVSERTARDAFDYLKGITKAVSTEATVTELDGNPVTVIETIGEHDEYLELELHDMLSTLSEKERIVAIMTYKGYKQEEIGEVLGHTQVHVSRLLKRVREKFTNYINQEIGVIA